jgi:hypothetical protein
MTPRMWLNLGVLAILLTAVWAIHHHGYSAGRADLLAEQAKASVKVVAKQDKVTVKVVTEYVDRVKVIHEKGHTIVQQIPIYVGSDSPELPSGWRILHDAAATNTVPDPAARADAAPVAAQDAIATVAENYETCLANAAQLWSLQDWVTAQKAIQ